MTASEARVPSRVKRLKLQVPPQHKRQLLHLQQGSLQPAATVRTRFQTAEAMLRINASRQAHLCAIRDARWTRRTLEFSRALISCLSHTLSQARGTCCTSLLATYHLIDLHRLLSCNVFRRSMYRAVRTTRITSSEGNCGTAMPVLARQRTGARLCTPPAAI